MGTVNNTIFVNGMIEQSIPGRRRIESMNPTSEPVCHADRCDQKASAWRGIFGISSWNRISTQSQAPSTSFVAMECSD